MAAVNDVIWSRGSVGSQELVRAEEEAAMETSRVLPFSGPRYQRSTKPLRSKHTLDATCALSRTNTGPRVAIETGPFYILQRRAISGYLCFGNCQVTAARVRARPNVMLALILTGQGAGIG